MSEFSTVFEVTAGGLRADAVGHIVLVLMLLGGGAFGLIRAKRIFEEVPVSTKRGFSLILVAAGLMWLLVHMNLFAFAFSDIDGRCETVEGPVAVKGMQPFHGHAAGDRIAIGGRDFEVNYFLVTVGYKETIAHGGALHAGAYARVRHCDGVILKVEIRKP